MYYEEKVINGVLHWRGHPDDNWTPCTPQELTAKLEGKAAALRAVREAPVAEVHGSMATEAPWLACKAEDPAAVYALHGQRVRLVPVGDDPIDASDNADYIEHCADRLERFGLPTTAGALRVIAHEHRALAQQPAADTYNRRLKAQLEQEWANLQDFKRAYQTQQPAAVAPVEAVEEALQRWLDWCNEHNEEPEARSGARIAIEALVQQPAAEVYVDFPQVGTAGPLAVVDGKVTLPDTTMNDLIRHARTGYVEQPAAVDDSALLDALASEYWKLDPFDMPTPGGDDADVGWRVIQYHRGHPHEREVAVHYGDDPRAALRAALAAQQGGSDNDR